MKYMNCYFRCIGVEFKTSKSGSQERAHYKKSRQFLSKYLAKTICKIYNVVKHTW